MSDMTAPPADPQGTKLTGDDVFDALVWNSGETHILPDQTADALNKLIASRQPSGVSGQLPAAPTPALDRDLDALKWIVDEYPAHVEFNVYQRQHHSDAVDALCRLRALKGTPQ